MIIKNIMNKNISHVNLQDNIKKVAKKMFAENSTSMPVIHGDEIVGLITKNSLIRLIVNSVDPIKFNAGEVMDTPPATCKENETIDMVHKKMDNANINDVIVVNKANKITGMVSKADMIKAQDIMQTFQ